jgi:hypothetical protein
VYVGTGDGSILSYNGSIRIGANGGIILYLKWEYSCGSGGGEYPVHITEVVPYHGGGRRK